MGDWTNIFTSSAIGERVKIIGEAAMEERVKEYLKDDAIKLNFHPALNTRSMSPVTSPNVEQRSKLTFHPLNYVSRTVTSRYKTWDEIWGEVGGAWATAVLLVSIFFVQKQVEIPPQHPEKQRKSRKGNSEKKRTTSTTHN